MRSVLPYIIFAVTMLLLGIVSIIYTQEIITIIKNLVGEKKSLINLLNNNQIITNLKISGIVAILIGLFLIFALVLNQ
jgi:hypothetical protein